MSLELLAPCCNCPDHQTPHRNDAGWILTGNPDDPETWEAWEEGEWRGHCDKYNTEKRAQRKARERERYLRQKGAA